MRLRPRWSRYGCRLLVWLSLFAAACGGSDGGSVADPATSLTADPVMAHELGAEMVLTVNASVAPNGTFDDPASSGPGECRVQRVVVGPRPSITLFRVGASCTADPVGRGNGEEPFFASADQLAGARNLMVEQVPLGTLTTAQVSYFECTNECNYWDPVVGVLELDAPVDELFPTIVIANDYEGATRDQLRQIAQALSRAG